SRADPPAATRSADQGSRSTSVFPASDVDSAAQPPSATVQDDDPPVSRTGAAASALAGLSVAVPLVTADARPRHPSSHSTLPPAVLDADASSSSPSAREPLRAEQVPPFTAQSAWAAVTDRRVWASASTTDASVLVRAEPVQPGSQPVPAAAAAARGRAVRRPAAGDVPVGRPLGGGEADGVVRGVLGVRPFAVAAGAARVAVAGAAARLALRARALGRGPAGLPAITAAVAPRGRARLRPVRAAA